MRELFTDKHFITGKFILVAKLLLALALLVFFIPLCILPFFNHPCADDYICGYHLSTKGFWEYQSFIYNNWGGRFTATFAGSLFANNNYLYDHYYIHSLLLLMLNILSVFFMVIVLNKYVLKDEILRRHMVWVCLMYVALQVCSLVEPSTYIFWFSSAITYQLPVVLLQLQVGLWILILYTENLAAKSIVFFLLPVVLIAVNGFNELFIVEQATLLLFVFLSGGFRKLPKLFTVIILMCFALSALVVVMSPGIQSRTAIIVPKGVVVGGVALSFHAGESLWSIFKNPLFWFATIIVFAYGNFKKLQLKELALIKRLLMQKWLLAVIVICFLIATIATAVIGLKGGIIPDRYVNALIVISVVLLLVQSFVAGIALDSLNIGLPSKPLQLLMITFLFIGILSNNYVKEGYKSLVSAPLYDAVMDEREVLLKEAVLNKQPAVLKSYNNSMQEHLEKDYSQSTKTLYDLVQQKPSFIFFEDDLATGYSIETLKNFYGVDSITIK